MEMSPPKLPLPTVPRNIPVGTSSTIADNIPDVDNVLQSCAESNNVSPKFHIELQFKSLCTYIRIPKAELKIALRNESYETTKGDFRHLYYFTFSQPLQKY